MSVGIPTKIPVRHEASQGRRASGTVPDRAYRGQCARLFAGLGYDGTDMRQIADAAGTDVAYVRRRFGDKREICLEVMDRMNSAHNAVLEKGVKDIVGASPEQKIVALHRQLPASDDPPHAPPAGRAPADAASLWQVDSEHPFPEPDVEVDGTPGWRPDRLAEIIEWRNGLPGRGAGGGRPTAARQEYLKEAAARGMDRDEALRALVTLSEDFPEMTEPEICAWLIGHWRR
ncbi:TetR/AcrR family transcriptional regulator [Microbispora bryophytorum]|uniref:TetR/AcrR family transcriptional regulator n=1 Tax=Microbispora bryophytorum TaxID=1460882 RepID=UPI003F4D6C88